MRLTDVFVPRELDDADRAGSAGELDDLQTVGFIWFELLISACYLGMASALVQRALTPRPRRVSDWRPWASRWRRRRCCWRASARMLDGGERDNDALARTLVARYAAQDAIGDAAELAVEVLGGMAFIGSPDVAYLAAASHCLAFHPPSRASAGGPLLDYFAGDLLRIA